MLKLNAPVVLAFLFFFGFTPAFGQWSVDPAVNTPIAVSAGDKFDTDLISDGEGGSIIAWYEYRAGGSADVYVQKLDQNGVPQWTPEGVAVCTAPSYQLGERIATDGDGGVIVVWHDERSGSSFDIYAQRIDRDGVAQWTTNGVPIAVTGSSEEFPAIEPDGKGGAFIAWGRNGIHAQRVDASGTIKWTANGIPVCTAGGDHRFPKIVGDGSGGALVTWLDIRAGLDVYLQRIDSSGVAQWAVNGVPAVTVGGTHDRPSMVSDGAGGAIVVWEDHRNPTGDIYVQRMDGSGARMWGTGGVPMTLAGGEQDFYFDGFGTNSQIVADGQGGAIVAWMDGRSGGNDVYAQRVNAAGVVQWTPDGAPVTVAPGEQWWTTLTEDGDGGAIFVWEDARNGEFDLYAQRLDAGGDPAWAIDGLPLATAAGQQRKPEMAACGNGTAVVSFWDGRNADYGIFAQNIGFDGTLGVFAPGTHVITASAGPNGTIAPSGNRYAEPGDSLRFTFHPYTGYHLDDVFVDDLHVDSTQGYTFYDIQSSHTIHATFSSSLVPQGIRATLSVNNGASSKDITFGLEMGAAYGIFRVDPDAGDVDSVAGETELPPAPPGSFDARFVAPPGNSLLFGGGSWVDVRRFSKPSQSDTFRISFQRVSPGEDPFVIRWSKEYIAASFTGPVTMDDGSIDMKIIDSAVFPPDQGPIVIVASGPSLPYLYTEGWNMVSIPVIQTVPVGEIFTSVASDAFAFRSASGYLLRDSLQPSEGLWLKFPALIRELEFPGDSLLTDTITIDPGWNLIGAMARPLPVSDITTIPAGILSSRYFRYREGYHGTDTLEPGRSYWVKATTAGLLVYNLPSGQASVTLARLTETDLGSVTIIDALGREQTLYYGETVREIGQFELPPVPPEGSFDVRFAGDVSILRSGPGERAGEIQLLGAAFPITVRWRAIPGMDAKLELGGAEQDLAGEGEVRLTAMPQSIRLVLGEGAVPEKFFLSEGYPNPFNPTTSFRVDLPAETNVSIKIYDVLGSEVATLVDGYWSPGSRVVTWDASGIPSGVYYCRIVAGGHSDARKVLLLR
jgi:hypothetical protein